MYQNVLISRKLVKHHRNFPGVSIRFPLVLVPVVAPWPPQGLHGNFQFGGGQIKEIPAGQKCQDVSNESIIYIYIYMYVCMYVCMYLCMYVCI